MSQELIQENSKQIDDRSIGLVEKEYVTLFESPGVLNLAGGGKLGPITVAYETYGELSPERDNVIYVCHALTGDAHAAGWHHGSDKPGWWDGFIGPGKGLDTSKYHVVCANILGGCQGTTGPGSINPATDQHYGRGFPFITVGDMVEVQAALMNHLGIEKLLAVIGGSLGGMQVLEWGARFPERVGAAIVLAAGARLSAQGIAFNCVGNRAISADPHFREGDYYGKEVPRYGLALARMLAHITYLSEASIEMKFGRRLQNGSAFAYDLLKETEFQIESYLHYQGSRFVERFDANSYLYITRAMDYFDLAEAYGSITDALGKTAARFLIASYDTDWLFPTSQSLELTNALIAAKRHVSFIELHSPFGHDSFLIELEQLARIVSPFLDQTLKSIRQ
ncbi:MAG: homoserine O-acetyltransferase [Planctomycetota bacterium]|nr:homoserine O-acetyltransferase [Planctomycetota bacterium]MDA1210877.1 homoserine O-acetyltransferase [Planctomycetota bacterium]